MPCPHCPATATTEQPRPTALGYRTFRCGRCRRVFNERTGTAFNHLQYPTDLVLLVVLWRLRYKLRLRDLSEMFLVRGFVFSHEAVRDWEARFAPLLTEWLRAKRRGGGTTKWHADETYLRVGGRWCSLYRAIDRDGNLIEALLSEQRDMDAAQRFFAGALAVAGHAPEQVTTDGHDAYPRAIRETLGPGVQHRTSRYKNNRIEQDHCGIKQRYYPMRGFGTFDAAARFCPAFEEQRQYFRAVVRSGEAVSLANRRGLFQDRWAAIMCIAIMGSADRIDSLKIALGGPSCLTNNRTRRWWITSEGGGREVADEFPGEARVAGPDGGTLSGGRPCSEDGHP